jgi:hypothetical protein
MQEIVFWGVAGFLSVMWIILALNIISLVDERVKIPATINKVFTCLVEELNVLCIVLIFIVNAITFGFLEGIVYLAFQVIIATAVGAATLWLGIIFFQIESATAKFKALAKIFWEK